MRQWALGLLKNETVFVVAAVIAIISCCFVHPDHLYASYVHWNTLAQLGSLMAVVAGFQRIGLFHLIGSNLLARVRTVRGLALVLVALPFLTSMLITNDVALVTFIPFAIAVLVMAGLEDRIFLLASLMTLGANLGSMLTPIGNAHNLYLKARSGIPTSSFLALMAPYTLASAVLLTLAVCLEFRPKRVSSLERMGASNIQRSVLAPESDGIHPQVQVAPIQGWRLAVYSALFLVCLLGVGGIVPQWAMVAIVAFGFLLCDRRVFLQVDWGLLLTFTAFFIFIGNARRIPAFYNLVSGLVGAYPLVTSVACSQVISNVPTALLVSGFSSSWRQIIVGTNLGGLGTLIASMASLISYKAVGKKYPQSKGRYLKIYTLLNVLFLAILLAMACLIE
ncbi:transport protein [Bifidobacterium actinocoloniiforme DSM 22766]|uniref:Transport protein n=1 Tax=Bifidobacterium actinocoloniiforme DSM 22766 TaxID=1437605 RepID=A0A086Z1L4_9BIFI|nr:SLC13 family permease [Bifidobacterium actinocoloniiforme]AKV56125.1 citrate transporter [Bifidobacterium actinocoloniiforme DSM 22766]KFI40414.1 transport protein [Bifidobacterium actinocoloniiforme DSM 22766]